MDIDRSCEICSEEALYNCKICYKHYCSEHLCSHLAVAWESNSWTSRNTKECTNETNSPSRHSSIPLAFETTTENLDSESLSESPTDQLQKEYYFHLHQARRIRSELEQRAVFVESHAFRERAEKRSSAVSSSVRRNSKTTQRYTSRQSKSFEVLVDRLRNGLLSLEYIEQYLEKAAVKKV